MNIKTQTAVRTSVLACVALILSIFTTGCSSNDAGGPVPRPAPYTRFHLLSGGQIPLEEYRGKIVAVVFWGSWCRSSKGTLEDIEELAREINPQQFAVMAVSLDRLSDEEQLLSVIKQLSLTHIEHAYSGNESLDEAYLAFKAEDVPHVFVIDEYGTIVAKGRSEGVIEEYLEKRGLR